MQEENSPLVAQPCSPPLPPLVTPSHNHSSAHNNNVGLSLAIDPDFDHTKDSKEASNSKDSAVVVTAPAPSSPVSDRKALPPVQVALPHPPSDPFPFPLPFPFRLPPHPSMHLPPPLPPPPLPLSLSLPMPIPAHAHTHTHRLAIPQPSRPLLHYRFQCSPGPFNGGLPLPIVQQHPTLNTLQKASEVPLPPLREPSHLHNSEMILPLLQSTAPLVQHVLTQQFMEFLQVAAGTQRQFAPTARGSCAKGPTPPVAHARTGQWALQNSQSSTGVPILRNIHSYIHSYPYCW